MSTDVGPHGKDVTLTSHKGASSNPAANVRILLVGNRKYPCKRFVCFDAYPDPDPETQLT